MKTFLFIIFQRLTPQHLLSRLVGYLARSKSPWLRKQLISRFITHFKVDLSEAEKNTIDEFHSFNDFFCRALKPNARPITPANAGGLISPADGAISQIGNIHNQQILQAKGRYYSLKALLANNEKQIEDHIDGRFATIYLSPKDYHRVHMPLAGQLLTMTHVPGDLFSVNETTAENIDNLFARNERVILEFETQQGKMIVILVGAMIVASIETVWHGVVTPKPNTVQTLHHGTGSKNPCFEQGDEIGRFLLGSTVIVLLPKDSPGFQANSVAGATIKMGQAL